VGGAGATAAVVATAPLVAGTLAEAGLGEADSAGGAATARDPSVAAASEARAAGTAVTSAGARGAEGCPRGAVAPGFAAAAAGAAAEAAEAAGSEARLSPLRAGADTLASDEPSEPGAGDVAAGAFGNAAAESDADDASLVALAVPPALASSGCVDEPAAEAEACSDDASRPDEICSDETCPEEICPEEICPDETCPDGALCSGGAWTSLTFDPSPALGRRTTAGDARRTTVGEPEASPGSGDTGPLDAVGEEATRPVPTAASSVTPSSVRRRRTTRPGIRRARSAESPSSDDAAAPPEGAVPDPDLPRCFLMRSSSSVLRTLI